MEHTHAEDNDINRVECYSILESRESYGQFFRNNQPNFWDKERRKVIDKKPYRGND